MRLVVESGGITGIDRGAVRPVSLSSQLMKDWGEQGVILRGGKMPRVAAISILEAPKLGDETASLLSSGAADGCFARP
jgi:hypothetical protein